MQIGRIQLGWLSISLLSLVISSQTHASTAQIWVDASSYSLGQQQLESGLYDLGRAQAQQLNHTQAQQLARISENVCSAPSPTTTETTDEKGVLDPLTNALTLTGTAQENALKQALEAAQKNDMSELYAYAAGWLGRIYLRQNKITEAKDILSKVGSDTAFTLPAAIALAEAHYKSGHPKKALAIWISLTQRYPHEADSIAAAVYAANTFAALGDEAQALNYFQFARNNGITMMQNIQQLQQDTRWIVQLEQQPEQLGDSKTREQLYDFYARNKGHFLLQELRSYGYAQNCLAAETKRLNVLKPAMQAQLKAWSEELQQLKKEYAELETQLKSKKKDVGTMKEVFHTMKTEEVLPQAKIESFGEQVERAKEAEKKRDPVNNYATIEDKKVYNLTPYQITIQSRERQSVRSAQNQLIEATHRWMEIGRRITELEQKTKRIPAMLAATEKKINSLNASMGQQQTTTKNKLKSAAEAYLSLKQNQLKNILTEAQMGELNLVDKAVHTSQATPKASQ